MIRIRTIWANGIAALAWASAASAVIAAPTLTGAPWMLTRMDGTPVEVVLPPSVTFSPDAVPSPADGKASNPPGMRLNGFAGCNSFFGAYALAQGGKIRVTLAGMTMMACDPLAMSLERNFTQALGAATQWEWGPGETLILKGEDDNGRLEFKRATAQKPPSRRGDPAMLHLRGSKVAFLGRR